MSSVAKNLYYIALIQVIVATLVSLYFSEIKHILPCVLCWYQRIFMYPLLFIISVGILRKDKALPYYVLPLSIVGILIAFYHYLLQFGIVPAAVVPCQAGVSCATKNVVWFGFITIPFLSFLSFFVITMCMIVAKRNNKI